MPTLNDVLAGSLAQAVQVQQIIDALKGTPNKGVPIALVSLNDSTNYALTVQNDDPTNSRALLVLKADGSTLIAADATGVTLGAPVNLPTGSVTSGMIADGTISTADLANASVTNAKLASDTARANLLTNGGFEIWQRGNGPFTGNAVWAADRWQTFISGGDTISVSKDTTNQDAGSVACAAVVSVHSAGSTNLFQDLKVADGYQLRGSTISASVRVKSTTAGAFHLTLVSDGTGLISINSANNVAGGYQTLSISNQVVPADATYVRVYLSATLSSTVYIDSVMLVVGSQPADYAPLHPADDLARCLRYYEVFGGQTANVPIIRGYASAAAQSIGWNIVYRARKAVVPTVTKNGTWATSNCGQPTISGTDADLTEINTASSAAGVLAVYSSAAGQTVTVEANP